MPPSTQQLSVLPFPGVVLRTAAPSVVYCSQHRVRSVDCTVKQQQPSAGISGSPGEDVILCKLGFIQRAQRGLEQGPLSAK